MTDGAASPEQELLKHFVASLAYRASKTFRGADPSFGDYSAGGGVRTPWQIVHHMSGVLSFAISFFVPMDTRFPFASSFEAEVERYFRILEKLRDHLDSDRISSETDALRLLQGPLSDAMTHVGQLAMLRRLSGNPIRPENFHDANVHASNVSLDQPDATSPDKDWFDADGKRQEF